jgi:hypothetical protein
VLSGLMLFGVTAIGLGACTGGAPAGGTAATDDSLGEWQTLFDGTSLTGRKQVGDANWQLADSAVQADTGTGFLLTDATHTDFDLQLEFWVSPDANSGVFIRCANPSEIGAATCYEVNIFDQRPDPTYRTGAIVNVAEPKVRLETSDRWNSYEISARGQRFVVKLNGQTTVDTNSDKLAAGPFALLCTSTD